MALAMAGLGYGDGNGGAVLIAAEVRGPSSRIESTAQG